MFKLEVKSVIEEDLVYVSFKTDKRIGQLECLIIDYNEDIFRLIKEALEVANAKIDKIELEERAKYNQAGFEISTIQTFSAKINSNKKKQIEKLIKSLIKFVENGTKEPLESVFAMRNAFHLMILNKPFNIFEIENIDNFQIDSPLFQEFEERLKNLRLKRKQRKI